ncbi:hypothetical protein MT418_005132 [Batrachochytrium dendrobatidis]
MESRDIRSRALLARLVQLTVVSQFYQVFDDQDAQSQTAIPNFLSASKDHALHSINADDVLILQCLDSDNITAKKVETFSASNAVENRLNGEALVSNSQGLKEMTDAQSTLDLAKSSLEPDSQPITIPPLVQSFCDFVLHFLPTLVDADASQEYLSGINLHVILSLLRKVAVATRTDVLFLIMHYTSLVVDIFNDECDLAALSSATSKSPESPHNIDESKPLQDRYARDLLIWQGIYCHQLSEISFNPARPLVKTPTLDEARMHKALRFINVIRTTFRSAFKAVHHIHKSKVAEIESKSNKHATNSNGSDISSVPIYWQQIAHSPSYHDLPSAYVNLMNLVPMLIAYILDNILDHMGRLRKICLIVSKLPVSFIIISLRFVNPAPLIERVLRLFLWQPTRDIYSLLQKLGAHLCDFESTTAELKHYHHLIGSRRASLIELALSTSKLVSLGSMSSLRFVLKEYGVDHPTLNELRYAAVYIRKREKKEFIDALAEPETAQLVIHLARIFPMILDDFQKYGDLASIVGKFFEALKTTTVALQRYGDYASRNEDIVAPQTSHTHHRRPFHYKPHCRSATHKYDEAFDQLNQDVVNDIETAWQGFLQTLFPVLHKLGKAAVAGEDSILIRIIDWLMNSIIGYVAKYDDESNAEHVESGPVLLERVLARYTEEEKVELWKEVDEMLGMALKGEDQRCWPQFPIMNQSAMNYFKSELIALMSV